MSTILITGTGGFIGNNLATHLLKKGHRVIGVSRHTNSNNNYKIQNLLTCYSSYRHHYIDLNSNNLSEAFEGVEYVIHLAAKTFVDHSVKDIQPFVESNINGTLSVLNNIVRYKSSIKKYIQMSTDEVYGPIDCGFASELAPLNPTNPYAATKAAADMLALGYEKSYGIPLVITRTENNYGEGQNPQKAIPKFISYALTGRNIPLYGDGSHQRMWLNVKDTCAALELLLFKDSALGIYNVGHRKEYTNLDLAKLIISKVPNCKSQVEFIDDSQIRPYHDNRYAINSTKLQSLGWSPQIELEKELSRLILYTTSTLVETNEN